MKHGNRDCVVCKHFIFDEMCHYIVKSSFMRVRERVRLAYSYLTKPKMWRTTKQSQKCRHGWMPSPCLCLCVCVHLPVSVWLSVCASIQQCVNTPASAATSIQYVHAAMYHSNCFIRQWQNVSRRCEREHSREEIAGLQLSLHMKRCEWDLRATTAWQLETLQGEDLYY